MRAIVLEKFGGLDSLVIKESRSLSRRRAMSSSR